MRGYELSCMIEAAPQILNCERSWLRKARPNLLLSEFQYGGEILRNGIARQCRLEDAFRKDSHLCFRRERDLHRPLKNLGGDVLKQDRSGEDENSRTHNT